MGLVCVHMSGSFPQGKGGGPRCEWVCRVVVEDRP